MHATTITKKIYYIEPMILFMNLTKNKMIIFSENFGHVKLLKIKDICNEFEYVDITPKIEYGNKYWHDINNKIIFNFFEK